MRLLVYTEESADDAHVVQSLRAAGATTVIPSQVELPNVVVAEMPEAEDGEPLLDRIRKITGVRDVERDAWSGTD